MIITCPNCKVSKDIGDVRIPKAGVTATCKSCQQQFVIYPEQKPAEAAAKLESCPACSFAGKLQPETDICPQCGIVISKYLARRSQDAVSPDLSEEVIFSSADEKSVLRQLLTNKRFWGITLVILIGVLVRFGHDWKMDKYYLLKPGNWQGEMSFRGKQHPFLLVIQSADDGKLEGYMDWIEVMPRYRLAIRGTYTGNHLLFEDYKFIEGSGQYGLHDNQDVYIIENEMSGTAKNGKATLHAVQVATSPDSARELNKY